VEASFDETRFEVVQNGINNWDIHDEDFTEDPITVSRQVLENQNLDLCNWYLSHRQAWRVPNNTPDNGNEGPPVENDDSEHTESTTGIYSSFELTQGGIAIISPLRREDSVSDLPESHTPPVLSPIPRVESLSETPKSKISPIQSPIPPVENLHEELPMSPEQIWELGAQGLIDRPACPIGDVMGNNLLAILEGSGPYPSDNTRDNPLDDLQFMIEDHQLSCYVIKDND